MSPRKPEAEVLDAPTDGALVRLNPQALITQALTANASIETVERLVSLAERVQTVTARQAWPGAMAAFQADCPPIPKGRKATIPLRSGGQYSYTYAALQDVLGIVRPVMTKHGLSTRWTGAKADHNSVTITCLVAHRLGHVEDSGPVTLPIPGSEEGRGMSSAQRASSAMTYAKRLSVLMALGLAPDDEEDDDGADPPGSFTVTPKVTEADRQRITADIMRLATERKLTTEERLEIPNAYLHGQPTNKATIEDLAGLRTFLESPEAVGEWRAMRERELEKGSA